MLTEELHQPEPEDAAVNLQKIMRSDVIKLFYVSKSDWEGAKQVALHFSALVISGYSVFLNPPFSKGGGEFAFSYKRSICFKND